MKPRKESGPKLQHFELSEKNTKLRWILVVVLLAVASVALVSCLMTALSTQPGWQSVEVISSELNCGDDFVLYYDFGAAEMSPTAESKQLTQLYSSALEKAYVLFRGVDPDEAVGNLSHINANVNTAVTVDPALYAALSQVQQQGSRLIYLAPVYAEYGRIFRSITPDEAVAYDPAQNPEQLEYLQSIAAYAADPEMVELELLGQNQVRLRVSDDYAAFADANELETFVDFGWLTNAFVADYLGEVLEDNGFTNGYLSSFDGFTRNLDTRGSTYSLNIFDRYKDSIYLPAVMQYQSPAAIVYLRNYPMSEKDAVQYYSFPDSHIVTPYVRLEDARYETATDNLVSWSKSDGCGQVALQMAEVFMQKELDVDGLCALMSNGTYSIWFQDTTLYCNDPALDLQMQQTDGVSYTKQTVIAN